MVPWPASCWALLSDCFILSPDLRNFHNTALRATQPSLWELGTATTTQPFQVVRCDNITCPSLPCGYLVRPERTREGQVHDGAEELEGSNSASEDWDLLSHQVW